MQVSSRAPARPLSAVEWRHGYATSQVFSISGADMQLDVNRNDLTVGIIGAGAMGRGIAQVAAAGGMQVLITDSRAGAAQEAREFVDKLFLRAAEKGSMT